MRSTSKCPYIPMAEILSQVESFKFRGKPEAVGTAWFSNFNFSAEVLLAACDDVTRAPLVPDLEERVPRAGANCHTIFGDAQARHSVIMASKNTCSLSS